MLNIEAVPIDDVVLVSTKSSDSRCERMQAVYVRAYLPLVQCMPKREKRKGLKACAHWCSMLRWPAYGVVLPAAICAARKFHLTLLDSVTTPSLQGTILQREMSEAPTSD